MSRCTLVIAAVTVALLWADSGVAQHLNIQITPGMETIRVKSAGMPNRAEYFVKAFFDPNSLRTEEHEPGNATWDCRVFAMKFIPPQMTPNMPEPENKPQLVGAIGSSMLAETKIIGTTWMFVFEGASAGTWDLIIEASVEYDRKIIMGKDKGKTDGTFGIRKQKSIVRISISDKPFKLSILPEDNFRGPRNVLGIGEPANVIVKKWNENDPEVVLLSITSESKTAIDPQTKWQWLTGQTETDTLVNVGNPPDDVDQIGYFEAGLYTGRAKIFAQIKVGDKSSVEVVDVTVLRPNDGGVVQAPDSKKWHVHNTGSIGFIGKIYLLPDNVSFWKIRFREGRGTSFATGYLAAQNENGVPHLAGKWIGIDKGISSSTWRVNTLKWNSYDEIKTPVYTKKPFSNGSFTWTIEWWHDTTQYKRMFITMFHDVDINAAGETRISKGGTKVSAKYGDPDSSFGSKYDRR